MTNTILLLAFSLFLSNVLHCKSTCTTIGSTTNQGIGVPLSNQAGYCYPAQSFTAVDSYLYNVGILAYSGTVQVSIYAGDCPGLSATPLYSFTTAVSAAAYNVFTVFNLPTPIATTPGQKYTIYPTGSATWFVVNQNYVNGRFAGMNPAGGCWAQGVGVQGATTGSMQINCAPISPPPPPPIPTPTPTPTPTPAPSGRTCTTIGCSTNQGIGLPLNNPSGYCYPAQSFTAVDSYLYSVGILAYSGTVQVSIYAGDCPGLSATPLYSFTTAVNAAAYNVFTVFTLPTPIATTPGQRYTIYPTGSATWFIVNQNYVNGRLSGMNPAGACWAQGVGVQGASTGCLQINC